MVTTSSCEAVQDWGTDPNQRASNLDRLFGQLAACRFIPTDQAAVAANPSALLSQPRSRWLWWRLDPKCRELFACPSNSRQQSLSPRIFSTPKHALSLGRNRFEASKQVHSLAPWSKSRLWRRLWEIRARMFQVIWSSIWGGELEEIRLESVGLAKKYTVP